jgi:hypothetical protein
MTRSQIRKSLRRWSTQKKQAGWLSLLAIGNLTEAKNGMLASKTPALMPTNLETGKPWQEEELCNIIKELSTAFHLQLFQGTCTGRPSSSLVSKLMY